jgi:hypothetical protein
VVRYTESVTRNLRTFKLARVKSKILTQGTAKKRLAAVIAGLSASATPARREHYKVYGLCLDGFTSIEDAAAGVLAGHKGTLRLQDLTSLSDVAAEFLSQHEGHVHLWSLRDISDRGLLTMAGRARSISWPGALTKRLKKLLSDPQDKAEAPREWVDQRIVLAHPGQKAVWRTQSFLSKHKGIPTSLFKWFTTLLPEAHLREVDLGYYKVQEMTEVAAGLLVAHRAFFEDVRSSGTRKKGQQRATRKAGDLKALGTVAAQAGVSAEDALQKHRRIAELAATGNLPLVAEMLTSGDGSWLHETLLAGVEISKEGRLVPGEPLRRLGRAYIKAKYKFSNEREQAALARLFGEAVGVLALTRASVSPQRGGAVRMEKLKSVAILPDTFSMLVEHVFRAYPALRPCMSDSRASSFLAGLNSLVTGAAGILARYRGDLDLQGLEQLALDEAKALAKHQGELNLDGLTQVTDDVAMALAQHRGRLTIRGVKSLSSSPGHIALTKALVRDSQAEEILFLDALESLSAEVAAVLSRFPGCLVFASINKLPEESAAALGRHKGILQIGGLASLSVVAARAIAGHKGELDFAPVTSTFASGGSNGVTLSDGVAEALSRHVGVLGLNSVSRMSGKAAAALSAHKGSISLSGLVGVREDVAKQLSKHKGGLDLSGLEKVSETVAEFLAAYDDELLLSPKVQAAVLRARKKLERTSVKRVDAAGGRHRRPGK